MKKVLLAVFLVAAAALVFGAGSARAEWDYQWPGSALVFPYVNSLAGYQTFILVSHMDTPTWNMFGTAPSPTNPNVVVKFNPKCGRGDARSFTLTTKQTLAITPEAALEGWAEAFIKEDVSDEYSDDDWPLSGMALTLDVANGVLYTVNSNNWYDYLIVDGASEPVFYGCDSGGSCSASGGAYGDWGQDADNPVVARLWRHSSNGRTMFVLLDTNGRHINDLTADNTTIAYLPNRAQLDLYSKSETDSHKQVEWCTGTDAGKPGIVTVGVGTTAGPLGTTDTSISNPAATMTDAPYGFAQAYNLRSYSWIDTNSDGNGDIGEAYDKIHLLGAVFNRLFSTSGLDKMTEAAQMMYYWLYY